MDYQQGDLFRFLERSELSPIDERGSGGTLQERFEEYHRRNPHVYRALRKLALDLKSRGRSHYGVKGLFEVLRWHYALSTEGDDWKLNNDYTSLYSRLLMENEPSLRDFFETREQRAVS